MLYVIAYLWPTVGGHLLSLYLMSRMSTDVYLHDTYFIAAYVHPLIVGAAIWVYFTGLELGWRKAMGRDYPKAMRYKTALILCIGSTLAFCPQLLMGMWSMHRRYHAYSPALEYLNWVSSLGTIVLALAFLLPLFYLLKSLKDRSRATE